MIKNTYINMNAQIYPAGTLVTDTIKLISSKNIQKPLRRPLYRRAALLTAILLICVVLATPVLAVNIPAVYNLMYLLSPQTAQFFTPVNLSCEDNGIKMEVISSYIHGDTAEIYISLQDLTGSRVDETTDLFDSYTINRAFDSTASCRLSSYDAQTKKATFLVTIAEWGGHNIEGSKITFSLREFLSGKTELKDIAVGLNLLTLQSSPRTMTYDPASRNKSFGITSGDISEKLQLLLPESPIISPVNGIELTGSGYINGRLHIQMRTADKLTLDTHGYLYLVRSDGTKIPAASKISFADGLDTGKRLDYDEFIFDIPQSELGSFELYGSFFSGGTNTKGSWRVTFPLKNE